MVVSDGGLARDAQAAFAELSRVLLARRPLTAILGQVARLARDTLPMTGEASVTVVQAGGLATVGGTGPLAATLDQRQHDAGLGPCLDAALAGDTVRIDDTAAETRYRDFASVAVGHGVRGVLSVGLVAGPRSVGSLNLYRTGGGPFDAAATGLARAFAGYAAGAVVTAAAYARSAETSRHLRLAMQSRAVIEQAKGILVARSQCSPEEAFDRLAAESQRTNRKLREIAADLVATAQVRVRPGPG
ncbi:GAF and ANTAR domain-containing protein [Geodermatophilus sabuli]|uniref:GAF and ANTAR domain-containing protein n=1 Tax=Geodermatophilus sabuli TaxID=1564158 RepID=A0A7K3VUD5_9ACTN|nr:GAF and ANTAR domain-containing protein [Geodermatophilus sabuli]NEK56265.1 GAF and ANTAR domain-containing protein [Geodermatophilus sabuli]